jgi:hypothetical protein
MPSSKFDKKYQELLEYLEDLPLHSDEIIRQTANHLRMLHYSFELGNMHVDLFNMAPEGLESELEHIKKMSFDDLVLTRSFEKEYVKGDRQSWAEYAKLYRMTLLVHKYDFLVRLRDNEPEAWDEVNETHFDS